MMSCKNCQYYTTLYIPPCHYLDNVREALQATTKSCKVCALFLRKAGEVMWLGQGDEAEKGYCEMFTEKEKTK